MRKDVIQAKSEGTKEFAATARRKIAVMPFHAANVRASMPDSRREKA
jgi:hypothetical protein